MWVARAAIVLLLGVYGWWRGEEEVRDLLFADAVFIEANVLLVAVLLVLRGLGGGGAFGRVACGVLAVVAAWGGLIGGLLAMEFAELDCQERGEAIRVALAQYRKENGAFPEGLADLPAGTVSDCGRRPLRGTILSYERVASDSYKLRYSVGVGAYEADETFPFAYRK